jgi:hypothetical protein
MNVSAYLRLIRACAEEYYVGNPYAENDAVLTKYRMNIFIVIYTRICNAISLNVFCTLSKVLSHVT